MRIFPCVKPREISGSLSEPRCIRGGVSSHNVFLKRLNTHLPYNLTIPFIDITQEKLKYNHTKTGIGMFMAVFFFFPTIFLHAWSVLSHSLRLYGLQPTRPLCLWVFPGKNTGVDCHFLLQGIFLTQKSNPFPLNLSFIGKRILCYICTSSYFVPIKLFMRIREHFIHLVKFTLFFFFVDSFFALCRLLKVVATEHSSMVMQYCCGIPTAAW